VVPNVTSGTVRRTIIVTLVTIGELVFVVVIEETRMRILHVDEDELRERLRQKLGWETCTGLTKSKSELIFTEGTDLL
jgi:hypothetical protein